MTDPNRVVVVKSDSCPGCKQFLHSLEKKEVKAAIKGMTGTDTIEILDVDKDPLAANIIASLDDYQVPLIAVLGMKEGKKTVCKIGDDLKPAKCVELKELPP